MEEVFRSFGTVHHLPVMLLIYLGSVGVSCPAAEIWLLSNVMELEGTSLAQSGKKNVYIE